MEKLLIKLKIKKPTPRIYYRLKSLLIYFQILDVNSDRIIVEENSHSSCTFKFYSKLGAVEITLTEYRVSKQATYSIDYVTYAGNKLFSLSCNKKHVIVEPCMGYDYNISAENIDLAILELEEYLANEFGDIKILLNGYLTAKRLAKASHIEQIKYLERP